MEYLIGKKILKIFLNEDYLKFVTDKGVLIYSVYGDCCSYSVFYDFYGVKNLLNNGEVIAIKEVPLEVNEATDTKKYQESISAYGYQITTKNEQFGEMTSVISFRNYSNGYYGGSLNSPTTIDKEVLPEIFDDVVDTSKSEKNE